MVVDDIGPVFVVWVEIKWRLYCSIADATCRVFVKVGWKTREDAYIVVPLPFPPWGFPHPFVSMRSDICCLGHVSGHAVVSQALGKAIHALGILGCALPLSQAR